MNIRRARVPDKRSSPSRVLLTLVDIVRDLNDKLRQMAIIRTKVSVFLRPLPNSLHSITVPALEHRSKETAGHLVDVGILPSELPVVVEHVGIARLVNSTVILREVRDQDLGQRERRFVFLFYKHWFV
jgi:hypothetical protein